MPQTKKQAKPKSAEPALMGAQWSLGAMAAVEDNEQENRRQAAIAARQTQIFSLKRASAELGFRLGFGAPNETELRAAQAQIQEAVFQLDLELRDLEASQSMHFPTASELANLRAAVDALEARVASGVAANSLLEAAANVVIAFGL
jgi:BMFP domain-containing protein YqiC